MSAKAAPNTRVVRELMAKADLQEAIVAAVRAVGSDCEDFVGIIVGRADTVAPGEANWIVKGIKYGKCNREQCATVVSACVAEKQLKFDLAE